MYGRAFMFTDRTKLTLPDECVKCSRWLLNTVYWTVVVREGKWIDRKPLKSGSATLVHALRFTSKEGFVA